MPDQEHLTEAQRKWVAAVRASLEASTGRSIADWAKIARNCPETAHRKRLAWMKQTHGLGQNYASMVLHAAFPSPDPSPTAALWADPALNAIFQAIRAQATALPDVTEGQRRSFTSFSRRVQFAAARPAKTIVRLGLAIPPTAAPNLEPAKGRDSWSERLHSVLLITTPRQIDAQLATLLRMAWDGA